MNLNRRPCSSGAGGVGARSSKRFRLGRRHQLTVLGVDPLLTGVCILRRIEGEGVRGLPVEPHLGSAGEGRGPVVLLDDGELLTPSGLHEVVGRDAHEGRVADGAVDAVPGDRRVHVRGDPQLLRAHADPHLARRGGTAGGRHGHPSTLHVQREVVVRRARDRRHAGGWTDRGSSRRTSSRGSRRAGSGSPICSIRPSFITAMVSAMVMASSWSCVTWMKVRPTSVWIRLSSTCIWRRSLRSRAPERLIEQQHGRLVHEGAGQRDALLLTARELRGLAPGNVRELHEVERLLDLGLQIRRAPPAQPERDVLPDVQVREQRVALEDRVDRPLVRLRPGDVLVADRDLAGRRLLEPGDHPQGGRLAAPGRAEQGEERARGDREIEVVDRHEGAEPLGQRRSAADRNRRPQLPPDTVTALLGDRHVSLR